MSAPSFQDLFDAGKAEAISRRPDLTYDEGDVSEMLTAAAAAMADLLTGFFAGRFRATYLDGAKGDDLTVLADDHWNIQREPASPASGVVSISRTTDNGAPAGTLAAGTVVATQKDANGVESQYTLDSDQNWALSEVAAKNANVTAILAGPSGNADLNKVNRFVQTPFDDTFVVNNPSSKMVGGEAEETDEELRERVRQLPVTLRRGTLGALEFGALQVLGVKKATAEEEVDPDNPSQITGIVNLFVTDSSGNSSPTMVADVETEIENWRPAGVVVNVEGGELVTQNITLELVARVGVDTVALATNVVSAVTSRVNKLKIGETLSRDIIKQAALNVDDNILAVNVSIPAVDVEPASNQIIRCGTVTVT